MPCAKKIAQGRNYRGTTLLLPTPCGIGLRELSSLRCNGRARCRLRSQNKLRLSTNGLRSEFAIFEAPSRTKRRLSWDFDKTLLVSAITPLNIWCILADKSVFVKRICLKNLKNRKKMKEAIVGSGCLFSSRRDVYRKTQCFFFKGVDWGEWFFCADCS